MDSRQRFKDIVEVSGDFAWETDADGTFVYVSPGVTIGYAPGDMVGKSARIFIFDEGTGRDSPFTAGQPVRDAEVWLRTEDGESACLRTSAIPVTGAGGVWKGARGVCRDVTEERRQHAAFVSLQLREALMSRIVRAAGSELSPDAMLSAALAETKNAFGAIHVDLRRPDEDGAFSVVAADSDLVPGDPPVLATVLTRMADGKSMVTAADGDRYYVCAPTIFRGTVTGAILIARPLDAAAWTDDERAFSEELAAQFAIMLEQIDSHRKLETLARYDELTQLLNRRAFFAELRDRLARIEGGASGGAMFYVDYDNFKPVNDVHGHKRGDEALIALSDLLTTKSRPGDLVGRLGGDEFAMWLERTDDKTAARRARELVEGAKGLRIYSASPDRQLGLSVGVAIVRAGAHETIQDLAARADEAMYRVKKMESRASRSCFPTPSGLTMATRRRRKESATSGRPHERAYFGTVLARKAQLRSAG